MIGNYRNNNKVLALKYTRSNRLLPQNTLLLMILFKLTNTKKARIMIHLLKGSKITLKMYDETP